MPAPHDSNDSNDGTHKFRALLDASQTWPGEYTFKFIVKQDTLSLAATVFQGCDINYRQSANGKYVSLTFSLRLNSSDEVIAIYEKAKAIPGVIAL